MPAPDLTTAARLSVAPMMDWTDRHCRMFHRQMSRRALLYTEMVTSAALVRGGADHLLDHDAAEHPVALQLGGADPDELAAATRLAHAAGYAEVNLNVGCPSDRVQSGCFGAVLMERPGLVADCVAAMIAAAPVEVTVKCRIGVDEQDPEVVLPDFLRRVASAGVRRVTIHARKAWLQGLSRKQNREVPPLDHDLVARMKTRFPDLHVSLNGGLATLDAVSGALAAGLDGAMVGRAAYHDPWTVLGRADSTLWGAPDPCARPEDAVAAMLPYVERRLSEGVRLHAITRHMLGLFTGRPGARAWRRHLSEEGNRPGAGPETLNHAMAGLSPVEA